jgi:DNA-binding protein H-NS
MKKLVATLVILGGLYLMNPTQILAQETTTEILKADLKKQSKIENARENLQKDESKTEKLNEKYSKDLEKFQKRNSSGNYLQTTFKR